MANKMSEYGAYQATERIRKRIADSNKLDELTDLASIDHRTKFIADRILKADPDLAPPHLLTNMEPHLSQADSQIKNYIANGNQPHAIQAIELLGKATQQVMALPLIASREKAAKSFNDILADAKQTAEKDVSAIAARVDELGTSLETIEGRQGEIRATIEQAKERADKVITDFQEQFSKSENARNERAEKRFEEVRNEIKEILDGLERETTKAREDLDEEASALVTRMEERDEETRRLAHAMGATGVSANFQATANANQKSADRLRLLAIVLFLGMVTTVLVALWGMNSADLDTTIVRLLIALVFAIPATYAARESTRQRNEGVRSRRLETELAALGPFIETLSEEKKASLREELVRAYFGKSHEQKGEPDSVPLGGTVMDILKWGREISK